MNRLQRAYLFGVITGMGAAVAYLWGLAWRRSRNQQQHDRMCAAADAFLRELKED